MRRDVPMHLLALAVAAAALAGCGGSKSSSSSGSKSTTGTTTGSSSTATVPTGQTPADLAAAAQLWARAVTSSNCGAIAATAYAPRFPAARCTQLEKVAPGPKVAATASYDDAAVADLMLSDGKRAAAIFAIGHDLKWRFLAVFAAAKPIVGTHASSSTAGTATVRRVLPAIAKGNCTADVEDFAARNAKSSKLTPQNCFGHAGTPFQKLLQQGIGTPTSVGGNERVQFYSVPVGSKHHPFVFILLMEQGKPRYLTQFSLPPVKQTKNSGKATKK